MKLNKLILSIICALACSPVAMAEGLFGGGPFNGFYVGGQGGYGTSNADATDSVGIGLSSDLGASGWSYGVLGGWGKTLTGTSVYLGIEGQYNWSDRDGDFSIAPIPLSFGWESDDQWSVGGRLGYLLGTNTMAFVRGAYANLDAEISISDPTVVLPPPTFADLDTFTGYEIGFGVEHIIGTNFTLRGEFVYSDYSDSDMDLTIGGVPQGAVAEIDDTVTEGRISVNYSF